MILSSCIKNIVTMATTMTIRSRHRDGDDGETPRASEIEYPIVRIDSGMSDDDGNVSFPLAFFTEQQDLVSEIFSFLDPPSMFKLCRGMPFVSPFLTHEHVIHSVACTLTKDTFNENNQCYRRNRHRYRHIQYHRIVVEKLIPNLQRQASAKHTPIQLLQAVSGRYCERCQMDLICITGW